MLITAWRYLCSPSCLPVRHRARRAFVDANVDGIASKKEQPCGNAQSNGLFVMQSGREALRSIRLAYRAATPVCVRERESARKCVCVCVRKSAKVCVSHSRRKTMSHLFTQRITATCPLSVWER